MGEDSKIEWCDHTFNPWWGCQRVSPGCEHCYAETFSKRVGLKVWGPTSERRFFGDKHWAEPLKWNAQAEREGVRRRVFCASMADWLEEREDLVAPRARLGELIVRTPWLDWLLLTKRPENMVRLAKPFWPGKWPANVWAGCTAEDQQRADERIPWLLEVPAAIRFLSLEPLLEAVDLENVHPYYLKKDPHPYDPIVRIDALRGHVKGPDDMLEYRVDWVIVGSESGPGARPMDVQWAATAVRQCKAAGVAVFTKQIATNIGRAAGDRKGGDPRHWPQGDWPREFPHV